MFRGEFLISDCVLVKYRSAPVDKIVFTFEHVAQTRPTYRLIVRQIGDVHVSLSALNFAGLGEAEMTAGMMLCNVATQFSLIIKHRLYSASLSDPDSFVHECDGEHEKLAHTLFQTASRAMPEDNRIPLPKRVHERLHRPWLKGKGESSEKRRGMIEQPKPICPLVYQHVEDPDACDEIIALIHQMRDWGQGWKNLGKGLLYDMQPQTTDSE